MEDTLQERPNILFILADDLGWNDVSYHGSEIKTPNIDQLAACGIELDQHYVCPMCTPTRASFLTGCYPGRFGQHATKPSNRPVLPDGFSTLASLLRECGYDTGLFGKWHLGSDPQFGPNHYGFNTGYGSLAGGVDPYNHRYKKGPYSHTWHRNCERIAEEGHVTDLILREAVDWIESRESPWFCYVPFTAVHIPVDAPQEWMAGYAGQTFDPDPERDRSFKRYAAYTSHMDWAVGQLMDALKRTCQLEETLIIFASDNGATESEGQSHLDMYPGWAWPTPRLGSNHPLRGQKKDLYEGGVRTPAVVAWPGRLQPGRCDHPLYIADWLPTLANLVGFDIGHECDGLDIWNILAGRGGSQERSIYWNFGGSEFALRQGDWKLIVRETLSLAGAELYNIASDPCEKHDLVAHRPVIAEGLLQELVRQREGDDRYKREDAP